MKSVLWYFFKRLAYTLPSPVVFHLRFLWKHRYWPHVNDPRSMTEKILWLMIWDRNPLRSKVVDRISVRQFVDEHANGCRYPKHLWVGEVLTVEVWDSLPDSFILKANHGSHMCCLVEKTKNTFADIAKKTARWLAKDYSLDFGEWVYKDLPRLLIAEERLIFEGDIPPDWKFFCGNGSVFLVMMNNGRTETTELATFYLPDFTRLRELSMDYDYRQIPDTEEPLCFKQAVRIAEQLSAPFDFIRVDLYLIEGSVYFGELTCFPSAGLDAIKPTRFDFEFGAQIKLNQSWVNLSPRSIWI